MTQQEKDLLCDSIDRLAKVTKLLTEMCQALDKRLQAIEERPYRHPGNANY